MNEIESLYYSYCKTTMQINRPNTLFLKLFSQVKY
jgi:hypothetical protein